MPINLWMNKQNEACPWSRMSLNNKKEQSTDACYDLDEPLKYYAVFRNWVTKAHTLYDSTWSKDRK